MHKLYLLFCLLLLTLAWSCKKNENADLNNGSSGVTLPNQGVSPVVNGAPKLVNFRINGAQCAHDSVSDTWYFPVSMGTTLQSYNVAFDSTAAAAVYINGQKLKSGDVCNYPLQTNQEFEVRVVNSSTGSYNYDMVITGLPVILLNTKNHSDDIGQTAEDASIYLIDPDYRAHQAPFQRFSNILVNIRGRTALELPKKAYAVTTVDAGDVDQNVSLLGLRSDQNWIFDAMFIDPSRMRDRLCTDLWNTFNNVPYIAKEPTALNGTRGYMTELFLNGKYNGIYCLTEKLDRKQLQADKQYGVVYKADDPTPESNFTATTPFDNTATTWGGWEIKYPNVGDTPGPNWQFLSDFAQYVGTASDADFEANIASKVDINNLVDYFIFENVIYATDNQSQNTFFSIYNYQTTPAFFYSPWDLDGTMGRDYDGNKVPNTINGAGTNNLYARLLATDAAGFKELVKTRWNTLKNAQLSKATVNARVEFYRNLLVGTGAYLREFQLPPNDQTENIEAQYMDTWYSAQYDLINNYINSL